MNQLFKDSILNATGAKDLYELEVVQNLWSGYGKIIRYGLIDCEIKSVVVKLIHLPEHDKHPHQWNNHFAHERKIKSYLVETVWYDRCVITSYSIHYTKLYDLLIGALLSASMMEVARKGVINPSSFDFTELLVLFVAVMLTDVILIDGFNTFGFLV